MSTIKHVSEKIESQFAIIADFLREVLPHGSGFDCKWQFKYQANGKVKASNSYHCMTENGFYDGYADFTIVFDPLKSLRAFNMQFNGANAHYKNKKYMLREYIESVVYNALPDNINLYGLSLSE